mgnify:CR=1 FL=1
METPLSWEQQEVFRLLKSQPGTAYQESDETVRHIFRDWVRKLLEVSEITVTFVKADGTDREMLCTLSWDKIPVDKAPKVVSTGSIDGIVTESKVRKEPDPHSLRVFDVEKQEWRSFRFDRLKKITAELKFE